METIKEVLYSVLALTTLAILISGVLAWFFPKTRPKPIRGWPKAGVAAVFGLAFIGALFAFGAVTPQSVLDEQAAELAAKEAEVQAKRMAEAEQQKIAAAEQAKRDAAQAERRAEARRIIAEDRARTEAERADQITNGTYVPPAPSGGLLKRIIVPSDRSADYWYFDLEKLGNRQIKVSTKRRGSSGTSYSRRIIDCGRSRFSYIKEADSWSQYYNQREMSVNWSGLVEGSISFWVAYDTCQAAGYL